MTGSKDDRLLVETATYPAGEGHRVNLYNDAAAGPHGGGAFSAMADAIDAAQHFIFIAGWSFHPLARLAPDKPPIGEVLVRKAKAQPKLLVAIHLWHHTAGAPDPDSDGCRAVLKDIVTQVLGFKSGSHYAWERTPKESTFDPTGTGFDPLPNLILRSTSRLGKEGASGFGWSHHQKMVALDAPATGGKRRIVVFWGGLDVTQGRFDWPAHPNLPDDPALRFLKEIQGDTPSQVQAGGARFTYDNWYSAELASDKDRLDLPRQTWHDVHGRLDGPGAWDFVREFVGRWSHLKAMGDKFWDYIPPEGPTRDRQYRQVQQMLVKLFNPAVFVQRSEQSGGPWQAQVYRSLVGEHWTTVIPDRTVQEITGSDDVKKQIKSQLEWQLKEPYEASIQAAYLRGIEKAQRFLYIESQFLIGSGALWGRPTVQNTVPEALVDRILQRRKDGKDFHVYILIPLFPEGVPTEAVNLAQRLFLMRTIEAMITRLYHGTGAYKGAGEEWTRWLSFYFLAQWDKDARFPPPGSRTGTLRKSRRYLIYVHSKMMIADDEHMILGSANLNERGLAGGRDSEIAVGLWPGKDLKVCKEQLLTLRKALWAEHLGRPDRPSADAALAGIPWTAPESVACQRTVQQAARQNYKNFLLNARRSESGHLCLWPLDFDGRRLFLGSRHPTERLSEELIPDAPEAELQRAFPTRVADYADARNNVRSSRWALYPDGFQILQSVAAATDLAE